MQIKEKWGVSECYTKAVSKPQIKSLWNAHVVEHRTNLNISLYKGRIQLGLSLYPLTPTQTRTHYTAAV